jgi:hypothetical protein
VLSRTDSDFIEEFYRSEARPRHASRVTISQLLLEFRRAVQAAGINAFWQSRIAGRLRSKPESVAQHLLELGLEMRFYGTKSGFVVSQFRSGIGFVDEGIVLSRVLHIVELKVLIKALRGPSQLDQYMEDRQRNEGWLVIFDARLPGSKTDIPASIPCKAGKIRTLVVDINPTAPSRKR